MAVPVVLWDFDGTLAYRQLEWRGAVMEILDENEPGHAIEVERIRPFLRQGFPWHTPELPHPELSEPGAWWGSVLPVIAGALENNGVEHARAVELASLVRDRYIDASRGWRLVEGAAEALTTLRDAGWHQAILSNHVPELPTIVESLGLTPFLDVVLTSAAIGFDKPNPRTYEIALAQLDTAPGDTWMVGDNPIADVAGPRAAGINAILVQHPERDATPDAVRVDAVPGILIGWEANSRPAELP